MRRGGGNLSTASKPDEFVSNKKEEKKLSTKAKVGIGAGILAFGGLVAAAILSKGKTLKPANFVEHIDFKPAKTMEEAAEFAKKHFNVTEFNFEKDLEFANWVNEGLVNINNRFKGKANMPDILRFATTEEIAKFGDKNVLGLCSNGGKLRRITFNKDLINDSVANFKAQVEKLFKPYYENGEIMSAFHLGADRGVHSEIIELYDKLCKSYGKITRFDALNGNMMIEDYVQSLKYFDKNKLNILKNNFLNNETALKIMKDNNLSTKLEDYVKLNDEQLHKKMEQIIRLVGDDAAILGTGTVRGNSRFGILYHEMGHHLHNMNTSVKDSVWGRLSSQAKQKFIDNIEEQEIAGIVSRYGQTAPKEFVAETFAALCAGKKLPDDVMKLYEYYKGPMLPNM